MASFISFRETALLGQRSAVSRVEKCQFTKMVQIGPPNTVS